MAYQQILSTSISGGGFVVSFSHSALLPSIQFCLPCLSKFCLINRPKVVSLLINQYKQYMVDLLHHGSQCWINVHRLGREKKKSIESHKIKFTKGKCLKR